MKVVTGNIKVERSLRKHLFDDVIDKDINLAKEQKILDRLIYPGFIANAELKMNWNGI